MFERYTEDARRVIFFARYEASRLSSPALEVEHLWLGLLRKHGKLVKRLAPHITADFLQQRLQPENAVATRVSMTVELPLSDAVKRALNAATADADSRGQIYITPELFALALLREENVPLEPPLTPPSPSPSRRG